MFLKSHHWVDVPYTRSERRRALNVRESAHKVMVFDKKYYDVDSNKYITDKIGTINSYSLAEMVSDEFIDNYYPPSANTKRYQKELINDNKWFTPKDNDFDLEDKPIDKPKIAEKKVEVEVEVRQEVNEKVQDNNLIYLGGPNHGQRIITWSASRRR